MLSSKNLMWKNPSIEDNGIHIAPTRRSVTAILDNSILGGFCSSLLLITAMTTNAFKRTAAGDIIDATAANIQGEMVSCTSYINCGICGQ